MIVLVLAFVVVAILVYKLWKPILPAPKAEVKPNQANLYFFYTNWCGFSQKAMPEWETLEDRLESDGYFGKTRVTPVKVDCEADQKKCSLYGIDGYPTVILETKAGLTDYTKRVTTSGLLDFLRQSLGKERGSL